jgi:hypothetical protein
MEYKQGLDRVGDSTSFPFPIKLEYDSENIYLTPLWIPETSSVLINKDPTTHEPINLLDANDLGKLYLCLEILDGKYRPWWSRLKDENGKKQYRPGRGGKYHLGLDSLISINTNYPYNNIVLNQSYSIQYTISKDNVHYINLLENNGGTRVANYQGLSKWFVYVRGTYRYGYTSSLQRTGIYSNVVKLEFDID